MSSTSSGNGSTISPRKLAANRENAKHSTGPRTPQGKAKSSKNATTHNAFCAHLLLPTEREQSFHSLRHTFLARLNPQDPLELHYADRILSAAWRLKRVQEADHHLHHSQCFRLEALLQDHDQRYHKPDDQEPDTRTEEQKEQDDLELDDQPPRFSPGLVIARTLIDSATSDHQKGKSTPYERLLNVESRLQGMMSRAMRELRQLQKERRAQEEAEGTPPNPHCPFLPPAGTAKDFIDQLEADGEDPALIAQLRELQARKNAGQPTDTDEDEDDQDQEDDATREGEAPPEPRMENTSPVQKVRSEISDLRSEISPSSPSVPPC